MLVFSKQGFATRADVPMRRAHEWIKDARIETLDRGHCIPLGKREEVCSPLEEFAGVTVGRQ